MVLYTPDNIYCTKTMVLYTPDNILYKDNGFYMHQTMNALYKHQAIESMYTPDSKCYKHQARQQRMEPANTRPQCRDALDSALYKHQATMSRCIRQCTLQTRGHKVYMH